MNQQTQFRVGEQYTNDQIRFTLDLENLGGIRPSLDARGQLRHIAILTVAEDSGRLLAENPYRDRIEGDVLLYTAQGRQGDQNLAGRNKRLVEQYTSDVPIYGFVNIGSQTYRFLGLLELLRHYQEVQADSKGTLRRVWLFELGIHHEVEVVPTDIARQLMAAILRARSRNEGEAELDREVTSIDTESDGSTISKDYADAEKVRTALTLVNPYQFEHIVRDVMERSGFRDVSVTRASGDGGIDINAYVDESSDFLAGTFVQAQVKRWRHAVGSVDINTFRGALDSTAKGIFVTTSTYTRAAILDAQRATKPRLTLVDGMKFASLVIRREVDLAKYR